MKLPTVLGAPALILLPSIALAMGCSRRGHQARSCAAGMIWDHNLQECVKQVSS